MKNAIHHIINVRSGQQPLYYDHLGNDYIPTIKELHTDVQSMIWGIEFKEGYFFSMIGIADQRDLTKAEFNKLSHDFRHYEREMHLHNEEQGFEMDMSGDCREPDLNPGGGPYNVADCI